MKGGVEVDLVLAGLNIVFMGSVSNIGKAVPCSFLMRILMLLWMIYFL